MRHLVRSLLLSLSLALLASSSAFAQGATVTNDTFHVTVTRPDGWTDVEDDDRATFNFKHEESHSRIEIIGTQLMTADVSDVYFNMFHETLASSEFVRVGREDKSYGSHSGTETIYTFAHSGVTLKVAVFQFVHETTAWVVVAYVQEGLFDQYVPAWRSAIESVTFSP